jgi:Big-like domain-containing protein/tectonin-like protein
LIVVIISSLGYSANLSAFPYLKPSSIDNKYDIPIGIPIVTSTSTLPAYPRINSPNESYSSETLTRENLPSDDTSIAEIGIFDSVQSSATAPGHLFHKSQTSAGGNTWSSWGSLGGATREDSQPAVIKNSDGRLAAFIVNSDNAVYYKRQTAANSNTWSGWTFLGGNVRAGSEIAVGMNSDNRLAVFIINSNNAVYYNRQSTAGSDTWSGWTFLGGNVRAGSEIAVGMNSDNRLAVFIINSNNAVYYNRQSTAGANTWSGWTFLGGNVRTNSNPVVDINNDGRLEVFQVGAGGATTPNQPPTADSKSVSTNINTPVTITLTGQDPENSPLTFNIVSQPLHAQQPLTVSPQNTVVYTPASGFTGSDTFTYVARDNQGATSTTAATVTITVSSGGGGGDAGTNDKFGIKKIYSTKPGGEQWFMNMQDPNNDPRTKQIPMSKNSDGSWRVTDSQVRYGVYTSSGYHPDLVVKDHSILATRGYMQSPNDWKNVEMTGQVKFNSGADDDWTWYARGGRNTGSGWPEGCEASEYKGSLEYTSGRVRWAKEQFHVSYVFSPWQNSPASGDNKFVGFKTVMYNFLLDGRTAVKMESYVDPNNDNQWQKVYDFVDKGGWGSEGGECRGAPDQIITWGGPVAAFRWDDAIIDIKNLSVREIVPPTQ